MVEGVAMKHAHWLIIIALLFRFENGCAFSMHSRPSATRRAVPQRTRLFTARYPLEGGPTQLKLHVAVVVADCVGAAEDDKAGRQKETYGRRFVLFDFLPRDPAAFSTTIRLLTGGDVPGNLRERELRYLPPGAAFIGESGATIEDMRAFVRRYPDRLSLLTNNCYSFHDAFIAHHRAPKPQAPSIRGRG